MRTLWTLLFWAITLTLATNALITLAQTHPGAAGGLGTVAIFAFCAAMSLKK